MRTHEDGCETNIADLFSKIYEKDQCFIISNSGFNPEFVTEMETTAFQEIIVDETEELKTPSIDFDFTQSIEFEETTEYFEFEQITTGFNYEFEEIIDSWKKNIFLN